MKKIAEKFIASFDTHTKGWSARKLSAFVSVLISAIATFYYLEPQYLVEVLVVWLGFAATCLGFVHFEQLNKNKNETNTPTPDPAL